MTHMVEPSGLSNAAIRTYAERIGDHYDAYGRGGGCNIEDLVRKLGGRVRYGSDSAESLHVNQVGDFVIFLPQMTSSRRDRFTIAHELGHYFLHYVYPERTGAASFGRGGKNQLETQANVFASSLLMPANEFMRKHMRLGGDVRALARVFDVSPAAVEVRAEVLGLS